MALTRSFLKGMGVTDEQITAIIEAHIETVDALKADRDKYKDDADKLPDVQKELDDLKKEDWKAKYEKEHTDFEAFKTAQTDRESSEKKKSAYLGLLKESGVSEKAHKLIMAGLDLKGLELNVDGKLKNTDKLMESIKAEYADFIMSSETGGAGTKTPPEGGSGSAFEKMGLAEKMQYANEHPNDANVQAWIKKS